MKVQCDFCKKLVHIDFIDPDSFFAIRVEDVRCEVGEARLVRKVDLCLQCVMDGHFTEVFKKIREEEKELDLIEP